MTSTAQSIDYSAAALKLHHKVTGSISRRRSSAHRRRKSSRTTSLSDAASVISGISSCCSESIEYIDDIQSSLGGGSSISESYNTPEASEPIGELDITKLTVDVPVQHFGDYRTINQSEFFMECMMSGDSSAIVHFFDENNPTSIELDMMLGQLAKKHTACKFLRIDSATTPYVCKKLMISSTPTIMAFRNKTMLDRLSDFDGSEEDMEQGILQLIKLISEEW